jgi:tetratricopeptide (TPR) repeat protein
VRIEFDLGNFEGMRPRVLAENYDRAVEAAPQLAVRWYWRGKFHREAGRYAEALRDFRDAVKREDPTNPRRLAKFCNALARLLLTAPPEFRNAPEAIALSERALGLWQGEWSYYNTLGIAYYRAGRYRDAVAALERSLANGAGQNDAADLYFLAMCHHRLGAPDRARECLARAQTWSDRAKTDLPREDSQELGQFRAEAEHLIEPARGKPE